MIAGGQSRNGNIPYEFFDKVAIIQEKFGNNQALSSYGLTIATSNFNFNSCFPKDNVADVIGSSNANSLAGNDVHVNQTKIFD